MSRLGRQSRRANASAGCGSAGRSGYRRVRRTRCIGARASVPLQSIPFLATTVETAGRYSFLTVDIPVGGGPRPHVHQEADEWFYVLQGNPAFHADDRTFTLAKGDFGHVPMGTTHWFEVLDAPIKVLAGYSPAGEELAFL
jgi:mannose-6-phosphate isomerase-like protein (cupin superfamily)